MVTLSDCVKQAVDLSTGIQTRDNVLDRRLQQSHNIGNQFALALDSYQLIKFVSGNSAVEPTTIELLFDDNGTYNSGQLLVLKDGKPHNLMLSGRTMHTNGDWSTLCLPFDIDDFSGTPLDGFTVKELDTETASDGHVTGIEGSTLYLNFKDATRIEAGKPYVIKQNKLAVHRYTAMAGTAGINALISYDKLIDDNMSTVWNVAFSGSAYCEFRSYVPMRATSYTVTTGSRPSSSEPLLPS